MTPTPHPFGGVIADVRDRLGAIFTCRVDEAGFVAALGCYAVRDPDSSDYQLLPKGDTP